MAARNSAKGSDGSAADADVSMRMLVLGDSAVGKSSLLLRLCDNRFDESFLITIGVDFKSKVLKVGGRNVALQVWDTAGQERFRTLTPAYYRSAMGVLVVYDVTEEASFQHVERWLDELQQFAPSNVQKVLVCNKCDLPEKLKKVSIPSAEELAKKHGMPLVETSAKTGQNVENAFAKLAELVLEANPTLASQKKGIRLDSRKSEEKKSKCC